MAVRLMLMQGKKAFLQAGAGIVADSDPARGFEESMNKAQAVLRAGEAAGGRREGDQFVVVRLCFGQAYIRRHPELAKDLARSASELRWLWCRCARDPSGLKSLRMTPVGGATSSWKD